MGWKASRQIPAGRVSSYSLKKDSGSVSINPCPGLRGMKSKGRETATRRLPRKLPGETPRRGYPLAKSHFPRNMQNAKGFMEEAIFPIRHLVSFVWHGGRTGGDSAPGARLWCVFYTIGICSKGLAPPLFGLLSDAAGLPVMLAFLAPVVLVTLSIVMTLQMVTMMIPQTGVKEKREFSC